MTRAAKRNMDPPEHPVSIAALANRLGISRQRVYALVKRGQIHAETMSGSLVVTPDEAARIMEAAIRVDTLAGNRLVFDFV
jgi:predicted site-specific integrase-resolvase